MSGNREVRVPKKVVYVVIFVAVALVCLTALVVSAKAATWLLAAELVVCGIAHLILPRGVIPQVRSRVFDAASCFILAALIAFFSPWASTPLIL